MHSKLDYVRNWWNFSKMHGSRTGITTVLFSLIVWTQSESYGDYTEEDNNSNQPSDWFRSLFDNGKVEGDGLQKFVKRSLTPPMTAQQSVLNLPEFLRKKSTDLPLAISEEPTIPDLARAPPEHESGRISTFYEHVDYEEPMVEESRGMEENYGNVGHFTLDSVDQSVETLQPSKEKTRNDLTEYDGDHQGEGNYWNPEAQKFRADFDEESEEFGNDLEVNRGSSSKSRPAFILPPTCFLLFNLFVNNL